MQERHPRFSLHPSPSSFESWWEQQGMVASNLLFPPLEPLLPLRPQLLNCTGERIRKTDQLPTNGEKVTQNIVEQTEGG